ncbi:MAG: ABC transporter permease [Anaerolineae bacterium]
MFSLRRLAAITRKEVRHITRDFRIFFLVTLSPAFLLVVLSYLFAFDAGNTNLVWLDWDCSPASRAYLQAITSDGSFRLVQVVDDYDAVEAALQDGRADIAVVVPAGFEEELLAGREAAVQAVADGSDAIAAQIALGHLQGYTAAQAAKFAGVPPLVQVHTRAWFNGDLKSLWSMVPGLMAIVLCLPTMALALAVKREEEMGTFEALVASPVTNLEYQLGKLSAYVLSGIVSAVLVGAVAVYWFKVPLRGSFISFILFALEFYLACMGISLLVTRFVNSQQTAMNIVMLIFFVPAFFVCGLIMPVNTDSLPALVTAYVLPATHFIAIARGVFLKGAGLAQLRPQATMLAIIAATTLSFSLLLFRKRLE